MCWAELKNVLGSTLGLKKGNTSKENKSEALEKKKEKKGRTDQRRKEKKKKRRADQRRRKRGAEQKGDAEAGRG